MSRLHHAIVALSMPFHLVPVHHVVCVGPAHVTKVPISLFPMNVLVLPDPTIATPAPTQTPAPSAASAVVPVAIPAAPPVQSSIEVAVGTNNATSTNTPTWACIRFRESTDNYGIVDPPYSGAYQFLDSTWTAVTGLPGIAADYSPAIQDNAALTLYREQGWSPWQTAPLCGA